jgi:hypothetical protein
MNDTGAHDAHDAGGHGAQEGPYRAEAVKDAGRWHLCVQTLDAQPERGDVDALVVTVPGRDDGGFPAGALDARLTEAGFARAGDWRERHPARWTAACRGTDAL